MQESLRLVVASITDEAEGVLSFVLRDPDGLALPPFSAGSHVSIALPDGAARQYSLCNLPGEGREYVIAVLRQPNGRGGSERMHRDVRPGDMLRVSAPANGFPLCPEASRHVLIAGGIGITPILGMARTLHAEGLPYELHYAARSAGRMAFRKTLGQPPFDAATKLYLDDDGSSLDVAAVLRAPTLGAHVYCCGPTGLIDAVRCATADWDPETVHFESFSPLPEQTDGGAFEVLLARSGRVVHVAAGQTMLAALTAAGVSVPSSCEMGLCRTCETRYLSGTPDHRDTALSERERADVLTPCVSRAKSARLTLDL